MEINSYSATYVKIQAYQGSSPGIKTSPPDKGNDGAKAKSFSFNPSGLTNKDGDTLSLSIQAITLQVTDVVAKENENPLKMIKSLLEKLGSENEGQDGSLIESNVKLESVPEPEKRPHGHNPQHVADHILKRMQDEYAKTGEGSQADFVDEMKNRLHHMQGSKNAAEKNSANGKAQDFFSQVNSLVASGLEAWAQGSTLASNNG